MPTIKENAEAILAEKEAKILPENIKSGITVFDIQGTLPEINNQDKTITENGTITSDEGYTGLGTVTVNVPPVGGDVKLFETVEEMQADPSPTEGDLAVVYSNVIGNATESSVFQTCTMPDTVVLPSAITDWNMLGVVAIDESVMFDISITDIGPTDFNMDIYTETDNIRIQYTSSDGITYTRTDDTGNPVDFGTPVRIGNRYGVLEWDDRFGYFFQVSNAEFTGLYEYNGSEYVSAPNQFTATPEYIYEKSALGNDGVITGTLQSTKLLTKEQLKLRLDIWNLFNTDNSLEAPQDCLDIFRDDTNLTTIPLLDTSNVTNMRQMFDTCTNLTIMPLLDTSNVTNMYCMFNDCTSLTTIPLLNTINVNNMQYMFNGCINLSNESLNNILAMCKNTTSYQYTKTLEQIGLTSAQATTCQSLSNYAAFTAAGWTTGY